MTTQSAQQATTWHIDAAHSSADFAVRHMMISKVKGTFRVTEGAVVVPDGSSVPTSVEATIDAASISTREADRDNHLRSADFLDVEKFPLMTFRSNHIAPKGGSAFTIEGELTLHGVTKALQLDAEFEGEGTDPWGNARVAYSARTKINRKDYGLGWNQVLETGGILVGDEIEISLAVEAVR